RLRDHQGRRDPRRRPARPGHPLRRAEPAGGARPRRTATPRGPAPALSDHRRRPHPRPRPPVPDGGGRPVRPPPSGGPAVKRLLALYPRSWRARYEAEMAAVLDDLAFDFRIAIDLAVCAADAHLHPAGGRRRPRLAFWRMIGPIARTAALALLGLVAGSLVAR